MSQHVCAIRANNNNIADEGNLVLFFTITFFRATFNFSFL